MDLPRNPDICIEPEIIVSVPTLEQEAQHLIRCINNMPFYNKNYPRQMRLPQHDAIDKILGNETDLSDTAVQQGLLEVFKNDLYRPLDYNKALEAYKTPVFKSTMAKIFPVFRQWQKWGFEVPSSYQILLSRWGSGGYNGPGNEIWVRTSPEGDLELDERSVQDPAELVVHEMIHKGLRTVLGTMKADLKHWEIESIVRSLEANFGVGFEGWREHTLKLREKFPTEIDTYLNDPLLILDLPSVLNKFIEKRRASAL